ncbi:nose resistant to fluoxetine protein 6-like [Penaeus japonicus]|uniref:nose resistant to fluoxetine protein 6-like n=1 Tax=Penaeus japonicus TaxID=27405 RepID=UPI001C710A8B|nr:nose resistant to fluoxetine protein 6-like [Penaeus japonicus]
MIPITFLTLLPPLLLLASSVEVCGRERTGRGALQSLDFLRQDGSSLDPLVVQDMLTRIGQSAVRKPDGQPWSLYLPVFADPESPCGVALAAMASSLEGNAPLGVLQMVDSWAKLRDGYLHGTPFVLGLGSFSECIHAQSPEIGVRGKYCSVFALDNKTQDQSDVGPILRLAQASASMNVGLLTQYGTCIPDACTEEDMEKSLREALDGQKKVKVDCQTLDEAPQFTSGDVAMISFLSVMLALLTTGTAADIYYRVASSSTPRLGVRFLLPFSAYTNLEKMFHVTTESRPGVISCLHGMRVLSMTWVILGHQYVFDTLFSVNLQHLQRWTSNLIFQVISNASLSTDSFFFLSGLLVSYGVLKEVKRTGRIDIIMYYVHRIIRLTPPIAVVTLFLGTLFRFLPSGPMAYYVTSVYTICSDKWWIDVLYVNNFLAFNETTNQITDCLGQCWYTAADTQMYLMAPLVLLPLAYSPAIGKLLLYVVTLVSAIIPAVVIYVNDFPPGSVLGGNENVDKAGYQKLVYYKPWCRMSAYVVGIWAGYIIFKQDSKKLHLSPMQVIAGWTVATFSALAALLGMWSYNQLSVEYAFDPVTQVLYGGLHRGVWCSSLAWVVVACHYGYGGLVNDFLSHPTWQPLSRLTYSIYLVALPIQLLATFNLKELVFFSHIDKIIHALGTVFISLVAAVLLSLTAEAPILGLEKLLFRRPGRGEDKSKSTSPIKEENGQDNLAFSDEVTEKLNTKQEMMEIEPEQSTDFEPSPETCETTQL